MKKIGFVGLGIMGKPMAKNLLKAGYDLTVFDINQEAVNEVVAAGGVAAKTAKDVAAQSEAVITMLPNSPHVKTAVLGENGVLEGAKPGLILIDMSSIAPLAAQESQGAVVHTVDGKPMAHNPQHGNGVNLNALGFADPTRPAKDNVWIDWVSGAVVRQGLPVKVKKV